MQKFKKALILGYGRSGQAAERLLCAEGTEIQVVSEDREESTVLIRALESLHFDVCIVSPGFAIDHPWVKRIQSAGIPLLSELELGWSRFHGRTIAVTGSNGKSTAVKWICEMLQLGGRTAEIGGNYGIPVCEVVLKNPNAEWLVLEVSSFQLETAREFRAEIAVVLNVLPNHLDRHGSMELYRQIKARIFGFTSSFSGGACLVPFHLLPVFKAETAGERRWITFGPEPEADYFYKDGKVFQGLEKAADLRGTLFESPVIGSCTGAAVIAVADECGVPRAIVETAAEHFQPLPHRLQRLGAIGGVAFVNDSKATNLAATAAALLACGPGIRLIAGGLPKESDYTFIKEILAERVRKIYLIGQASRAMYQAWNGDCPCLECGTLEKAFSAARSDAKGGETILLSPGCASFDQFRSFEERGRHFADLFRQSVQAGGDAS